MRRQIQLDFNNVFLQRNPLYSTAEPTEGVHVLLCPSAIGPAPKLSDILKSASADEGEKGHGVVDTYVNDVFTVPPSLAGIPAVSVPFGKSSEDGYPIGLQLISQYGFDRFLLRIADTLAVHS